MKSIFTKDFWRLDSLRATWEYKSIAFILRAFVALAVIMYLLLTLPATWGWAQKTYARQQPPAHFKTLIATAAQTGDFTWAHTWLMARPMGESAQHAAVIEDNISILPPLFLPFLVQISDRAGQTEQTQFWTALARYRTRFDLLRCGIDDAVERFDALQSMLFSLQLHKDHLAAVAHDPARMAALLQRVLDYDAAHPARNAPDNTCAMAARITGAAKTVIHMEPAETWQTTRHTLRVVTEQAIAAMRAQAAAGQTP